MNNLSYRILGNNHNTTWSEFGRQITFEFTRELNHANQQIIGVNAQEGPISVLKNQKLTFISNENSRD